MRLGEAAVDLADFGERVGDGVDEERHDVAEEAGDVARKEVLSFGALGGYGDGDGDALLRRAITMRKMPVMRTSLQEKSSNQSLSCHGGVVECMEPSLITKMVASDVVVKKKRYGMIAAAIGFEKDMLVVSCERIEGMMVSCPTKIVPLKRTPAPIGSALDHTVPAEHHKQEARRNR